MNLKPFHLPAVEPGTIIRLCPENGGGFLLACPNCAVVRFTSTGLLWLMNGTYIDSTEEIQCQDCGEVFAITHNLIVEGRRPGHKATGAPAELKAYGRVTA